MTNEICLIIEFHGYGSVCLKLDQLTMSKIFRGYLYRRIFGKDREGGDMVDSDSTREGPQDIVRYV